LGSTWTAPTAVDNLRRILDRADGFFVRIDMESSLYTAVTLEVFETLWQQGSRHMGVVLQAELHRTEQDLRRIVILGARVRLVKGAYREPRAVAYQSKADVDRAFVRLMRALLADGVYPAIATHDPDMIAEAQRFAAERGLAAGRFEFQMLYGIRRDLQHALLRQGCSIRIYIPFGRQWFPYFMRRLGERPANIGFVLRGILKERTARRRALSG
jgi:proline dehydrogenase